MCVISHIRWIRIRREINWCRNDELTELENIMRDKCVYKWVGGLMLGCSDDRGAKERGGREIYGIENKVYRCNKCYIVARTITRSSGIASLRQEGMSDVCWPKLYSIQGGFSDSLYLKLPLSRGSDPLPPYTTG